MLYRGPFSYILPELGQRKLFVISRFHCSWFRALQNLSIWFRAPCTTHTPDFDIKNSFRSRLLNETINLATFLNQCFLVWKTLVFCQERHQTLFLSPFCPKRMGEKISNLCPKLWTNPFKKCKFCDFLNKSDVFIVKKGYLSIYSTSPNTFKHLKRKEGKFSRLTKILDVFVV